MDSCVGKTKGALLPNRKGALPRPQSEHNRAPLWIRAIAVSAETQNSKARPDAAAPKEIKTLCTEPGLSLAPRCEGERRATTKAP